MYHIVTGAAGFIGSNLVKALNDKGITNIIAKNEAGQTAVTNSPLTVAIKAPDVIQSYG